MVNFILNDADLSDLDNRHIAMIVGDGGVGKTYLATLLRSDVSIDDVNQPIYPTHNPLLDTLMSQNINAHVEYVTGDRITLSTKSDIVPKLTSLCGEAIATTVASRITRIYLFVGARQYIRFRSYKEYRKYANDPSAYGPVTILDVPTDTVVPPSLHSAPDYYKAAGGRGSGWRDAERLQQMLFGQDDSSQHSTSSN